MNERLSAEQRAANWMASCAAKDAEITSLQLLVSDWKKIAEAAASKLHAAVLERDAEKRRADDNYHHMMHIAAAANARDCSRLTPNHCTP